MTATPPRPASPSSRPNVVPKSVHPLQISPNLEALLEHDELTRRSSSSPTGACYTTSPGFPISLPPPPPRKVLSSQRRELEPFRTTRSKEEKRKKRTVFGSDGWPTTFSPDGTAADQSPLAPSSRPVTPNPYLNPTPTLGPINTQSHVDVDDPPTPRQDERTGPNELKSEPSRSWVSSHTSDPSHRPSGTPSKVEKILWMGRDSLSLFSSSAKNSGFRRSELDRHHERAECGDHDAVQDGQMRQVPGAPVHGSVSRPASRLGDCDTATALSSGPGSSHSLQQGTKCELTSETASTRSCSTKSGSSPTKEPSPVRPHPTAFLPRLSLPSIFMSSPPPVDDIADSDYLSFIDFFPPFTSEGSAFCTTPNTAHETSSSRPHLESISIPPLNLYSISRNGSSTSLASMKFAPPPSPTSVTVHQPSPTYSRPESSASSVTLASMTFAPPSPSAEHISPTRLQPLSGPSSPYSPLEFALPASPLYQVFEKPPSFPASELVSDRGRTLKPKKRSMSSSPRVTHHPRFTLPPTTNQLDANERAHRVRRNRKLARVFGRTPGMDKLTEPEQSHASKKSHPPSLGALLSKQKTHRQAMSVSVSVKTSGMKTEPSTPWQRDGLWSLGSRRHSTPLATNSFTLYVNGEDGTATKDHFGLFSRVESPDAESARSFIDLSDEDVQDDDASCISYLLSHSHPRRCLHHSNSFPSLVETLDSEAEAEAERRQKREKLARLHRFLGSRVPPEAVNGSAIGPPLPPLAVADQADHEFSLHGIRGAPRDGFDRIREELDEKEKALNVRRAQKMEKVFGTPPPQTLFHTRPLRPTVLVSHPTVPVSHPTSPASLNPYVLTLDIPSSSRNPNQSAYVGKTAHRPSPSDSSRCLLPRNDDASQSSPSSLAQSFADSFGELSGFQQVLARPSVYLNYQHSLNSLIDIIDRDDRQSLVELHHFLRGEVGQSPSDEEVVKNARRTSNAASLKSERRHSLPSNPSITSLSSEFNSSESSWFQVRRRKAAKLTHFFGVDYRELIHDILESIERGVEEECKQGTLQPQEVEVLMHRVRSLRSISSFDNM